MEMFNKISNIKSKRDHTASHSILHLLTKTIFVCTFKDFLVDMVVVWFVNLHLAEQIFKDNNLWSLGRFYVGYSSYVEIRFLPFLKQAHDYLILLVFIVRELCYSFDFFITDTIQIAFLNQIVFVIINPKTHCYEKFYHVYPCSLDCLSWRRSKKNKNNQKWENLNS